MTRSRLVFQVGVLAAIGAALWLWLPRPAPKVEYIDRWRTDTTRTIRLDEWVTDRGWASDQRDLRIVRKYLSAPPGSPPDCKSVLAEEVIEDKGRSDSGGETKSGKKADEATRVIASGETRATVTPALPDWAIIGGYGVTLRGSQAYSATVTRRILGGVGVGAQVARVGDETAALVVAEWRF